MRLFKLFLGRVHFFTPEGDGDGKGSGGASGGETFSREYVHDLREEAKNSRIEAARLRTELTDSVKMAEKKIALLEIRQELKAGGLNIEAESVYVEGKTPADCIKIFAEKNPSLFKVGTVRLGVGLEVAQKDVAVLDKPIGEIKNDKTGRALLTRIYGTLLQRDREKGRRLQ